MGCSLEFYICWSFIPANILCNAKLLIYMQYSYFECPKNVNRNVIQIILLIVDSGNRSPDSQKLPVPIIAQ